VSGPGAFPVGPPLKKVKVVDPSGISPRDVRDSVNGFRKD
jgi:hypothetical protein